MCHLVQIKNRFSVCMHADDITSKAAIAIYKKENENSMHAAMRLQS